MNEKVLQAVIRLKDNISKPLNNVTNAIGGVSKQLKQSRQQLNQYESAIDESKTSLKNIKNEIVKTSSKINELEKAIANGEDATGELTQELKDNKAKLKDLRQEASQTKNDIQNYSDAVKEASDRIEELKNKQSKVSDTFKNMSDKLKSASDTVSEVSEKFTKAGTLITGSLMGVTTYAVTQASEIDKVSKMIGMGVEDYQKWDKVLKSTGYSMEDANGDFIAMAERMAVTQQEMSGLIDSESDLTQICKELGISVTDSNGNLKDTGTFMEELIGVTSKLENETHKQAVMTALLSTTGEELIPHLDEIAGGFKSVSEEDLIKQEQIDKMVKLKEEAQKLWNKLQPLAMTIAESLIPVLSDIADKVSPIVEKVTNWVQENPQLTQTLFVLGGVLLTVGGVLQGVATALGLASFGMMAFAVASSPVTLTVLGIIAGITILIGIITVLWVNWDSIWSWICEKTSNAVNTVSTWIQNLVAWASEKWENFKAGVSDLVENVKSKFSDMWEGIMSKFEEGVSWVQEKWEGLKSFLSNPIQGTVNLVKNVFSGRDDDEGQRSAWGTRRVIGNDVPYRLHDGERILTRSEADRYDKDQNAQGINITVNGLTVREEADIDKIASAMVRKIKEAKLGYSGVIA